MAKQRGLCVFFAFRLAFILSIAIPCGASFANELTYPQQDEYARVIKQARNGEPLPAVKFIENHLKTVSDVKTKRQLINDLVVVLQWAGRDKEALSHKKEVDLKTAPAITMLSLGKSARNAKQFKTAVALYRKAVKRFPSSSQARLGLAYALSDSGDREGAIKLLKQLKSSDLPGAEVKTALEYVDRNVSALTLPQRDEYARVIKQARRGKSEPAIKFIRNLLKTVSDTKTKQQLVNDLVVVLQWADRDKEAMSYKKKIDLKTAPVITMLSLGQSARNTERFKTAVALYREAVKRFPSSLQARIDLTYALVDNKNRKEATRLLAKLKRGHPSNADVEMALGYLYESGKKRIKAFWHYNKALKLAPARPDIIRQHALLLSTLGAPGVAMKIAGKHPKIFTKCDKARLRADRASLQVRYGQTEQVSAKIRFRETDQALESINKLYKEFSAKKGACYQALALRTRFDKIIALHDRVRMKEVINEYQDISADGVKIPPYIIREVGGAYLYMKKPKKAIELYKEALKAMPNSHDNKVALFFGYVEQGDYDSAIKLMDAIVAKKSAWRRGPWKDWNKLEAATLAAVGHGYADQLADAQEQFEDMTAKAPFNEDLRQSLANIYLWRGWPNKALYEFQQIVGVWPKSLEGRLGKAFALADLGEYRQAEELSNNLKDIYPEHRHVQQLDRLLELRKKPEFTLDGSGGSSRLGPEERYAKIDSYIYSGHFAYDWRVFGHAYYEQANIEGKTASYERQGAGIEYDRSRFTISGEAYHENKAPSGAGFALSAKYEPGDHLSLGADYDSFSHDIPLQALVNDVTGHSAGLSIGWRGSELWETKLSGQSVEFSDSNQRNSAYAEAMRRVFNGPYLKIPVTLELYGATNSKRDTAYYNPEDEYSASITADFRWLMYRLYERSLSQNLAFNAGMYWQKNYDPGPTGYIRYEVDWNVSDTLGIVGRVTWYSDRYNGAGETSVYYGGGIRWLL